MRPIFGEMTFTNEQEYETCLINMLDTYLNHESNKYEARFIS